MTWINTPLQSGALPTDNFSMNIEGLCPNTDYSYRSYIIHDGNAYCGNVRTGKTGLCPTFPPTVSTGDALFPIGSTTEICVINNTISSNGGLPVECGYEYGILYTQNVLWRHDSSLRYENIPNVCVVSTCGTSTLPFQFTSLASGLAEGTCVYYRAYSKNATGVGYGSVEDIMTPLPPAPVCDRITVVIEWLGSDCDGNGYGGSYRIMCCTGSVISIVPIYEQAPTKCTNYCVSCVERDVDVCPGCYYVDFSTLQGFVGYAQVCGWWFKWEDNYGSGTNCCTGCFYGTPQNNIQACISSDLVPPEF